MNKTLTTKEAYDWLNTIDELNGWMHECLDRVTIEEIDDEDSYWVADHVEIIKKCILPRYVRLCNINMPDDYDITQYVYGQIELRYSK